MAPDVRTVTFRAMGTDAHVSVVDGTDADLEAAASLILDCERRWSRFLPTSEVSQLNRSAGHPVLLPPDTYALVAAAVDCWTLTAGRFDPTVLGALVAAGYDDSFERASQRARPSPGVPGCGDIVLDADLATITLPPDVAIDLGGIAKGHAADLCAALLLDRGAAGVRVNLGGDLRVCGLAPDGDAWTIGVADPLAADADIESLRLADGGVATSTVLRRRWRDGDVTLHHLIDPSTGRPATSDVISATVVAGSAAWAEVVAKAALLAGTAEGPAVIAAAGATGLLVDTGGHVIALAGLEAFT